jgi:hypothetical protein
MRKEQSDFQMNYTTETGSLAKNSSCFDFVELDDFACWIAADINTETDQEIANIIVRSILRQFTNNPTIAQQEIKQYIINAQELVVNVCENTSIKVGLAIIVTDYSKILCIATGNERLYHLRRQLQLGDDAAQVLELGAADSDGSDRLDDYADQNAIFGLFIAKTIVLHDGDVVLIGNSGFWENAGLEDISDALQGINESFMFLYNLKELVLRKQAESMINYTVVAIFINRVYKNSLIDYLKTAIAVTVVMLFMIGLFVFKPFVKPHGQTVELAQSSPATQAARSDQNMVALYEQAGDNFVKLEEYLKASVEFNKAISCAGLKETAARNRIQKKLVITQMIIAADQLATEEKFAAALAKYEAAKKAASKGHTYDLSGLQKRAATAQVKLIVNAMVAAGDRDVTKRNFKAALDQYISAKALAKNAHYDTAKLGLKRKILKIKAKLTTTLDAQQRRTQLQAENEKKVREQQRQQEKVQTENEKKYQEQQSKLDKLQTENEKKYQEQQSKLDKLQTETEEDVETTN